MQQGPFEERGSASGAKGHGMWLRRLYGLPGRGRLALGSLVLFVMFVAVLFPTMNLMYRAEDDPTVVSLQLAFTPERFKEILLQWSTLYNDAVETFKLNVIMLDYVFPIIYAATFAFGYAWTRGNRSPTRWDMAFFVAPFVAGLFDWMENSLHLLLVRPVHDAASIKATEFAAPVVFAASAFALAKMLLFVLVVCAVLGILFKHGLGILGRVLSRDP